jgi:hypothetical protein
MVWPMPIVSMREISTVGIVDNHDRRPIAPAEVLQWIEYLRKVFESGVKSEIFLSIKGLLTPEASRLLRNFFEEEAALFASADVIVFPVLDSLVPSVLSAFLESAGT